MVECGIGVISWVSRVSVVIDFPVAIIIVGETFAKLLWCKLVSCLDIIVVIHRDSLRAWVCISRQVESRRVNDPWNLQKTETKQDKNDRHEDFANEATSVSLVNVIALDDECLDRLTKTSIAYKILR